MGTVLDTDVFSLLYVFPRDSDPRVPSWHQTMRDDEVIEAYADLSAACQAAGHPLQDKPHTGDRWIAACAIAKRFALLSGDGIFADVPNLSIVL